MPIKIYTAQEMRDEARFHAIKHGDDYIVAAMLRQAAEALEREKKYEYAEMYSKGEVGTAIKHGA